MVRTEADDLPTSIADQPNASLVGVRGWLYFLMLSLLVLGPLVGALRIILGIYEAESQYPVLQSSPHWTGYKVMTFLTYLLIAALSIWGGWGLAWSREWSVVTRAKFILWVIGPLGAVIMGVVIPIASFGKWPNVAVSELIGDLSGTVIAASIWTMYLSTSKRVRATYARSPAS